MVVSACRKRLGFPAAGDCRVSAIVVPAEPAARGLTLLQPCAMSVSRPECSILSYRGRPGKLLCGLYITYTITRGARGIRKLYIRDYPRLGRHPARSPRPGWGEGADALYTEVPACMNGRTRFEPSRSPDPDEPGLRAGCRRYPERGDVRANVSDSWIDHRALCVHRTRGRVGDV